MTEMSKVVEYESISEGDILFKQGDVGDKFYIVLTGKVYGFVANKKSSIVNKLQKAGHYDKNNRNFTLGPGDVFGELALLGTDKRMATIIAAEDTEFLVITKSAFKNSIGNYKVEIIREIEEMYRNSVFLNGLHNSIKHSLATRSFSIKYPANTVVVRQGELPMN